MKKSFFNPTLAAIILTAIFAACKADITTLPEAVTLGVNSVTLSPGESFTLIAEVTPDEAAIKTMTWHSSDPEVVTVAGGVVTGIVEGRATITVTTNSGQKAATCIVTVAYTVSSVVLNNTSAVLDVGESMKLTATVFPSDAPDQTVNWESSNPDVVTVTDGILTAKSPGRATITVVTEVGHRTATCRVRVLSDQYMAMALAPISESAGFSMSGNGVVEIDWGDGTECETHTLTTSLLRF
jgi:uncharacterized protein YjdB